MHSGSHVQDAGAQVLMKTGLYGALAVWWFLAFRVWDFRAHRLDANRERGFRAKIVFAAQGFLVRSLAFVFQGLPFRLEGCLRLVGSRFGMMTYRSKELTVVAVLCG